ncbi:MAG: pectate lyase [Verrucomicrobia bacterium]|nr:pectate lyase [Verrucomicrobiota bacterium]
MKSLLTWLLALASAVAGPPDAFALPAFPGAEGFGANSAGGRGGRVIEVTTLADAGPGSLRAAVESAEPRIVVFRVAGTIELKTEMVLANPFITIAGQTAPGGGITLKTHPSNTRSALTIARGTHDVIIRHLRSRPGPHEGFPKRKAGKEADSSEVKDAIQILGARNVILDHCSASWATDEVISTFYDAQDITIQWCIIAEALRKSRPDQSLPGKGLLVGSKGGQRISIHHNLLVHNVGRNPLIKAGGIVDVVNNVVLAPASVAMAIDAELAHSPANFVGNYVLAPKADGLLHGLAVVGGGTFSLFLADNFGPHRQRENPPEALFVNPANNGRRWIAGQRHAAPPVTTLNASEAFVQVLASAGCTLPMRDAVDERIINDVRQGVTRLVDNPDEVGGWPALAPGVSILDSDHDGMPDSWEKSRGFNPSDSTDAAGDQDKDGYTNVEEYLNGTNPRLKD